MRRRRGWPSPFLPVLVEAPQDCTGCGRRAWLVVVFVEHDEAGDPTGLFQLLCASCMAADGDPLQAAVLERYGQL